MNILFDYFGASFKELTKPDLVRYLGLQNVNWIEGKTRNGWTNHDYFSGIHLYSGGRDDIGIELSGVGCRTLETLNDLAFDWLALFRWMWDMMVDHTAHVSRLDVAGDDKDGILKFDTLVKYTKADKYICKARKRHWTDGDERIIMFGSSASETRLRIYDKALERGVEGPWIRCEFQLRDDAAYSFIANYLLKGDIGETYGGVLLNYLRYTIKKPNPDCSHDYDSLKTTVWWARFLFDARKIKNVTVGGLEYNMDALDHYISVQCASSIRTFLSIHSVDHLLRIVAEAPLSVKQKELLARVGAEPFDNTKVRILPVSGMQQDSMP